MHATLEPEEETKAAQATEEVRKLAKILKAGTEFRTLKELQWFIQVARERVEGTLETMDRLNNEVKEFTELTREQTRMRSEHRLRPSVYEFEEAMLAWEREESDSYSGAELESNFEPFREELLDVLDKILALEGAAEKSEREKWAWIPLQQAAYVSHLALEVHDDTTPRPNGMHAATGSTGDYRTRSRSGFVTSM
jgi:hypothetical protein